MPVGISADLPARRIGNLADTKVAARGIPGGELVWRRRQRRFSRRHSHSDSFDTSLSASNRGSFSQFYFKKGAIMTKTFLFIDGTWLHLSMSLLTQCYGRNYQIDYGKLPSILASQVTAQSCKTDIDLVRTYFLAAIHQT
jgi:hypothetical protein